MSGPTLLTTKQQTRRLSTQENGSKRGASPHQRKGFFQVGRCSGGRRSCGAAQQVAAALVVAARPEPCPPPEIVRCLKKAIVLRETVHPLENTR